MDETGDQFLNFHFMNRLHERDYFKYQTKKTQVVMLKLNEMSNSDPIIRRTRITMCKRVRAMMMRMLILVMMPKMVVIMRIT